ncbi:alpha/beta fold hydrolase [Maribacter sp. 2210JD10-5]|uniref:alpha/beta fold hydrolase n=1 Tax=Maribacter sp. 2210JD10-5 TaxID=3386272 RepID=UPI0039BD43C2
MRKCILIFFSLLLCNCSEPVYKTVDGILEVPENRENPNSRTLNLVYKVLKAKTLDSLKAPIVFLQGGPGASTLIMEEFWKNNPLRNNRDIILMDQRGTGESQANCVNLGKSMFNLMKQDVDGEGEYDALKKLLAECKKTMNQKGVDFAGYSSKENAADFEDLRKVLGYKEWNLFGSSYGSRLGLTIMRDYPKNIRSAVLSAIVAPETDFLEGSIQNFETSLFSVFERCNENKACNRKFPELKQRLIMVLKKLNSEPLRFDYDGKPFVLNSQDALFIIFVSLYNRYSIGNIPLLIEAFEKGEIEHLKNAIKSVEYLYNLVNWPMNYSLTAYEELPFNDHTTIERSLELSEFGIGLASYNSGLELLENWHSFRAPDSEDEPIISEIPTLMTSGGLDHVTPIKYAREAIEHLKNGYELIFLDEAHDHYNSCFFQIAEDFLNNPDQKPNTDCSNERNPIEWNLN